MEKLKFEVTYNVGFTMNSLDTSTITCLNLKGVSEWGPKRLKLRSKYELQEDRKYLLTHLFIQTNTCWTPTTKAKYC